MFGPVDARKGEQFDVATSGREVQLPEWDRMDVTGRAGFHDVWRDDDFRLVVSARVMALLREFDLTGADVARTTVPQSGLS